MIQPTNMQNAMPTYPQGGANAVAINIFNPQAYGTNPNAQASQVAPYQMPQSFYNIPYASMYGNTSYAQPQFVPNYMNNGLAIPQPYAQPQFVPNYMNNGLAIPQQWQQFMPVSNIMNAPGVIPSEPQFVAPEPMAMPESVLTPAAVASQPQVVQADQTPAETPAVEVAPKVEVVEPQQAAQVVDVDGLIQGLKNADANVRMETINKIASYAQEAPEISYQIVAEPVMQSLVDIINEDTSKLQGPTKEQIAVAEKMAKGETLTAEEQALAEQISPLDMANHNRTIALYTLAMIQKLQREELNQYIANQVSNGEQPCAPLAAQDLIGYPDMVNVIKNDPSLKVRIAAIEGLGHILEPNDKATVEPVLIEAQKSSNEDIKQAATDALAKLAV
ncbi:MAG: HEAT repeat domain-containing protein [Candidatus Gastranaerophilales bacterium]|nr:HEAT repeat domain-containing protein [Candidatus Gastranaerophilales bacterium]